MFVYSSFIYSYFHLFFISNLSLPFLIMLTNFPFNLFIAYSCRIPNNLPSYSPHLTHTWVVLNHFDQLPRLVHKLTIFVAIKSAFQLLQFPFELATLGSPPPSPFGLLPLQFLLSLAPFTVAALFICLHFPSSEKTNEKKNSGTNSEQRSAINFFSPKFQKVSWLQNEFTSFSLFVAVYW